MDNFHPENFVERCLAGNAQAFEPLVRHYQNAAFATALRYVRSRVDAQDIVQDAFVAAYCRLGQLRDKERFGGWLMHIVANRCKDWLRDRRRTQPLDSAETTLENAAAAEHADQMRRLELQEAVDLLPEHYRSAVLMYYLSGLSYREIAELMEVPLSTVCGRLQQGRIRLRQLLDEPDHEEIAMQPIDVTEQVQEVVCQIATRQVQETIQLRDTERIVLYCALDTDLEIRQAEGEDAVLEGTLSAIGLTREKARESVEGIEIGADQVDYFFASGPHEGEVFMGTREQNGHPKAMSMGSGQIWRAYFLGGCHPWGVANGVKTTDAFPQMQAYTGGSMPADMRLGLGRATRITVYREKLEDIILPPSAVTAEVQKVFRPNSTSLERVHGPVGSASLVLLVPEGKRVTVIKGKQVRAFGLQGSISFIESTCEEVADIEGDVELFDSALETARNIRGKLYQRYYRYLGVRMEGREISVRRHAAEDCRIEDICGGVDIDVGSVQIKAARLGGRVRIYNRFGQTQLHQDQLAADSRIELESCAGDIHLSLAEALLDEVLLDKVHLTAFTLCGQIQYAAFEGRDEDRPLSIANNSEVTMLSNAHSGLDILAADFVLKSEAGAIAIEQAK
ncbi:MAG: sigma-70 family RNA polymerase sigma factor [Gemmatimonadetes bacterium]|nr:sigma-70 family RNA polymerase sigma factor [Gemmatimonadota bacterium]